MPQDSPISRRDLLGVGAGAAAGLLANGSGRMCRRLPHARMRPWPRPADRITPRTIAPMRIPT